MAGFLLILLITIADDVIERSDIKIQFIRVAVPFFVQYMHRGNGDSPVSVGDHDVISHDGSEFFVISDNIDPPDMVKIHIRIFNEFFQHMIHPEGETRCCGKQNQDQ
jgi:hypothetical protein